VILLKKGPMPDILKKKSKEWTKVVVDKLSAGVEPTKSEKGRYNHQDVKDAIIEETHGKCAYCESKILHVAYGDIEHVVPKKTEPKLWFDWNNLTLACDICNTNKDTHDNLVDPYDVNPETRFMALGVAIVPVPGDNEAFLTERYLELNRDDLVGRRRERMEYLHSLLEIIATTSSAEKRAILVDDFQVELEDSEEYAATCRAYAREAGRLGLLT
jgi:hypothetical protein